MPAYISFLGSPNVTDDASIISMTPSLVIPDPSSIIDERIVYRELWVRNSGDTSAVDFGFFISPRSGRGLEDSKFSDLLRWASSSISVGEKEYPCGVFTVFGFDDSDTSNVENFLAGSLYEDNLRLFQHNWLTGRKSNSPVPLSIAKTMNSSGGLEYQSNLRAYSTSEDAIDGNRIGMVRLLQVVIAPEGTSPIHAQINHCCIWS